MATFSTMATFFFAAVMSCAAAEGEASLRGSASNAPTEAFNSTGASSGSSEALEALPITNFAVSNHGCNVKCVYSDWARGVCHGTTCVCSGLKSSHPLSLPNTCQVPHVSQGDDSCNVVCVYSDWFRGRCSGSQCVCSGGKTSQPVVVPGDYC